jgi:hypothetical protein
MAAFNNSDVIVLMLSRVKRGFGPESDKAPAHLASGPNTGQASPAQSGSRSPKDMATQPSRISS